MVINVKDFGAVGDGQTDDTAAIQAAVDSTGGIGASVLVPAGTYLVSAPIILSEKITLFGEGMGATVLKIPDQHNQDIIGLVRTPFGNGTHYVSVRDLTLDGNRENQTGAEHYGFFCGVTPARPESDFDIACTRVEARNFWVYGFDPHEVTTRLTLTDCVAHDNGRDGFVLDGTVNAIVTGCISYNNGRHGINVVTASRTCILSNNICYGNGENGITIQNRSQAIQIIGNTVRQNADNGIYCIDVDHTIIQNNDVRENYAHGIRIDGCPFTTITGNTLKNNSQGEHDRYSEILIDDNDDIGTYQTLVAINVIESTGEVRARYGIQETTGENSAIQDQNAYIGNRIFGAATANLEIQGRHAEIRGNVAY